MNDLLPFLSSLDALQERAQSDKDDYVIPAMKRLGSVSLVVVREIIAPTVFRNQEEATTDMEIAGQRVIRAVPAKFKHKERARGLQVLRHFGAGGRFPQNRTAVPANSTPGQSFDLNTLVFGDSAMHGKRVLPVKAGFLYSDALGLSDYASATSKTFHNRASEDGSLFDPEEKKNSDNIFERHFVLPGTLLVQTISTHGRTMPMEALEHLMLSIGLAGAYAGQTSLTGTNVRTHLAALVASPVERPEVAPSELLKMLWQKGVDSSSVEQTTAAIYEHLSPLHVVSKATPELNAWRDGLVESLANASEDLAGKYKTAAPAVSSLFDAWFGNPSVKPAKTK